MMHSCCFVWLAPNVAHALLRAVSALVPTRCAPAKRREESRRGTHECVRHGAVYCSVGQEGAA
jgi:hypothetical protein